MQKPEQTNNPFQLKLEQEIYLSDKTGVLYASSILKLTPGCSVVLYLPDGTEIKGLIKEAINENGEKYCVYGEATNKDNTGFGFVLSAKGVFAGAVVFRNSESTYTVQYSVPHHGYILLLSPTKKDNS
jgi:hypothetical protein